LRPAAFIARRAPARDRLIFRRALLRPLTSPRARRVRLVVAAAIRLATRVLRPLRFADALIFSYCRFRFELPKLR